MDTILCPQGTVTFTRQLDGFLSRRTCASCNEDVFPLVNPDSLKTEPSTHEDWPVVIDGPTITPSSSCDPVPSGSPTISSRITASQHSPTGQHPAASSPVTQQDLIHSRQESQHEGSLHHSSHPIEDFSEEPPICPDTSSCAQLPLHTY